MQNKMFDLSVRKKEVNSKKKPHHTFHEQERQTINNILKIPIIKKEIRQVKDWRRSEREEIKRPFSLHHLHQHKPLHYHLHFRKPELERGETKKEKRQIEILKKDASKLFDFSAKRDTRQDKKLREKKPFGDKDKDGVMNALDCKPSNKKKQDMDFAFGGANYSNFLSGLQKDYSGIKGFRIKPSDNGFLITAVGKVTQKNMAPLKVSSKSPGGVFGMGGFKPQMMKGTSETFWAGVQPESATSLAAQQISAGSPVYNITYSGGTGGGTAVSGGEWKLSDLEQSRATGDAETVFRGGRTTQIIPGSEKATDVKIFTNPVTGKGSYNADLFKINPDGTVSGTFAPRLGGEYVMDSEGHVTGFKTKEYLEYEKATAIKGTTKNAEKPVTLYDVMRPPSNPITDLFSSGNVTSTAKNIEQPKPVDANFLKNIMQDSAKFAQVLSIPIAPTITAGVISEVRAPDSNLSALSSPNALTKLMQPPSNPINDLFSGSSGGSLNALSGQSGYASSNAVRAPSTTVEQPKSSGGSSNPMSPVYNLIDAGAKAIGKVLGGGGGSYTYTGTPGSNPAPNVIANPPGSSNALNKITQPPSNPITKAFGGGSSGGKGAGR